MAKYKRWQWPEIFQKREQTRKPPHHAHVRLRGVSTCRDCGVSQPWPQLARYGGICEWCWLAYQQGEVVMLDG